jgi:hypothetical protein
LRVEETLAIRLIKLNESLSTLISIIIDERSGKIPFKCLNEKLTKNSFLEKLFLNLHSKNKPFWTLKVIFENFPTKLKAPPRKSKGNGANEKHTFIIIIKRESNRKPILLLICNFFNYYGKNKEAKATLQKTECKN